MNLRPALLAAAALAVALLTTLALCRWGAGGRSELSGLVEGVQHDQELESRVAAARRRYAAKRALAAEVVAGRLSLREAADQFRRLGEVDTGFPSDLSSPPRDEQSLRAEVLQFVWEVLAGEERFAAAARWYGEAFAAGPQLLVGPPTGHRS
jgi:hypothetical protein